MRKIIALAVAVSALAFAAPAFPIAITNPANGTCHEAVTPATFKGSDTAFPNPWNGVFKSNSNSAISGVFCP